MDEEFRKDLRMKALPYMVYLDRIRVGNPNGNFSRPATHEQIQQLRADAVGRSDLRLAVPDQYVKFLEITNGFYYDNFGIASTRTFVEENDRWKSSGTPANFIIFGEDESMLYVLELNTGKYAFFRWDSDLVEKSFESFDAMLAELLRQHRATGMTVFEIRLLTRLVSGNLTELEILDAQSLVALAECRESFANGFRTHFLIDDDMERIPGKPSFVIDDVIANVLALQHPVSVEVVVTDGALASIEVRTKASEPWPRGTIESDTFSMEFREWERDLESLKRKLQLAN
jgi:hypothetical protein